MNALMVIFLIISGTPNTHLIPYHSIERCEEARPQLVAALITSFSRMRIQEDINITLRIECVPIPNQRISPP